MSRQVVVLSWILALGLLYTSGLYGQKQAAPVFEAFTDTRELFQDSYVEFSLVLRNGEGTQFTPPDFTDFRVISGPSRGISTTIINGVVQTEMRFSYTLQPRRSGMLRIGSAAIKVGTKTLRTKPIELSVRKGSSDQGAGTRGEQDFFVLAEVNKRSAYVGEQIRLDYNLYTRVDIQSYNMVEESDYLDFYVEDLQHLDGRLQRKIVKGKEYYVRTLRSLALYPQKAGMLEIEPAALELGVLVEHTGMESLFFGGDIRRAPCSTEAVRIEVKPTPEEAPASYSGAVGDFSASFLILQKRVTTDDVITLQLNIGGDGDLKRVDAPIFPADTAFEVYPPKLVEEAHFEEAGKRVGRKLYEYLIVPKAAGTLTLKPEFTYFDPVKRQYQTLSETFDVTIQQGVARRGVRREDTLGAVGGLRPLMEARELNRLARPLAVRFWFWALVVFPFIGIGIAFWVQWYRRRVGRQAVQSKKHVRQMAREHLQEAARYKVSGDSRAFFQAISSSILMYAARRLDIPLAEQSKEKVLDGLQKRGMDIQHLQELRRVLERCELALFAGQHERADMEETYQSAERLLEAIDVL